MRARVPFLDMVLRTYLLVLLLSSGGMTLVYVLFYTTTTFSLSYGTDQLGLSSSTLLYCTMISLPSWDSGCRSSPRSPTWWGGGGFACWRRGWPGSGRYRCAGSWTRGIPFS